MITLLIYIINKITFFTAKLKEHLHSGNSNYYNWRFGKIFYTKKGTGAPLLLIHDLNCTSSDYEWKEVVNLLSKNHTVYTIDLIGCGRSDKPKITYTNFLFVQLLNDFIKNVIKHKTDVIATGNSASIVFMACYMDQPLFNHIIMVNPSDFNSLIKYPKYHHKILKYMIDIPIFGTLIYNLSVRKSIIKKEFASFYYARKKYYTKRQVEAYYEAAHLGGSASKFLYSSIQCHYTNANVIRAVKELNHNICIIGGEMMDNIEDLFDSYISFNPSIETVLMRDAKYLPQMEQPEEFVELCEIYL